MFNASLAAISKGLKVYGFDQMSVAQQSAAIASQFQSGVLTSENLNAVNEAYGK